MGRARSAKAEAKRQKTINKELQKQAWKLAEKKPLQVSIREHIGKFIDKITMDDVFKLTSTVSLAIVIKPLLAKLPEVQDYLQKYAGPYSILLQLRQEIAAGNILTIKNPLTDEVLWSWRYGEPEPTTEPAAQPAPSELALWLLSFAIASLIVYFGPAMLQSLGGVRGLTSLFLT